MTWHRQAPNNPVDKPDTDPLARGTTLFPLINHLTRNLKTSPELGLALAQMSPNSPDLFAIHVKTFDSHSDLCQDVNIVDKPQGKTMKIALIVLGLVVLAAIGSHWPAHAGSCHTTCYAIGNTQHCNTYCY